MAARNSGERSRSFAVACELLSRYVRSGGGGGIPGLSLGAKADAQAQLSSQAAASLLPAEDAARTDDETKETMELFPQTAGFGEKKPEQRQLTIFYKGTVLVYDDFPEEKARELMQLASAGTAKIQGTELPNPTTGATREAAETGIVQSLQPVAAPPPAAAPVPMRTPPACDLPIMRKQSLHRFLEKRKDRINSRAPYQATASSSVDAAPKKQEESRPWLGIAPNGVKPAINLNAT